MFRLMTSDESGAGGAADRVLADRPLPGSPCTCFLGVSAARPGRRTENMARIKQNGILGQLLRDSWLAFTEGLL